MVSGKRRKIPDVVLLVVFCSLTLLINFAHTEHTLGGGQACPACKFQSSSIATQVIQSPFIPQIDLVEMVPAFRVGRYEFLVSVDRSPRGPPQS